MSEQRAFIDLDDDHRELREPVRALCARYPGEYWREKDRERAYPGGVRAGADRRGLFWPR